MNVLLSIGRFFLGAQSPSAQFLDIVPLWRQAFVLDTKLANAGKRRQTQYQSPGVFQNARASMDAQKDNPLRSPNRSQKQAFLAQTTESSNAMKWLGVLALQAGCPFDAPHSVIFVNKAVHKEGRVKRLHRFPQLVRFGEHTIT